MTDLKKNHSFETRCSQGWIWPLKTVLPTLLTWNGFQMLFYYNFYLFLMFKMCLNCVVSSIVDGWLDRWTDGHFIALIIWWKAPVLLPAGARCDVNSIKACLFRSPFCLWLLSGKAPPLFLAEAKPQHNYVFITFWKACFPSAHFCLFCLLYSCWTGPVAEIWLET